MSPDIHELRRQWTDLPVVVDSPLPEHARFLGRSAVVKTVNQNGRALIQFVGSVDITWYDIDPTRLRVVPQNADPAGALPAQGETPA
jgi:hypothetical protein